MVRYYPSEMGVEKYSYGDIPSNIKFLVYYSPLRYGKSRVRAWKTLVALEEKGYIFGFYINYYGSLNTLQRGLNNADTWTYWAGLKDAGGRYDEIDSGEVIVFFTPKGLKANTKINTWTPQAHINANHVELLKKDKKLKQSDTNPKIVDDLVRLVYLESVNLFSGLGIINQTQLFDEEKAVNYELIKKSIQDEMNEKRGY